MGRYSLKDKVAILTGATGGLGRCLAYRLANAGAHLILSGRSEQALAALAEELPGGGRKVFIAADLTEPEQVTNLVEKSLAEFQGVDLLINNAGVGYFALMEQAGMRNLRKLFEVNTFAPFAIAGALIPSMRLRGSGRIVNIVSCAGRVPIPTVGVYGGSKSALAIMANTMRLEMEGAGIDVLNIYPGTVDTSFEENAFREMDRGVLCPNDSCGSPREEIADKIMKAIGGPAGEVWLDKRGRIMAALAVVLPLVTDRILRPVRRRALEETKRINMPKRRWRLWQVETSFACGLKCIMCPWQDIREKHDRSGLMQAEVWSALVPHLPEVEEIDFTGGGEPLLHSDLETWIGQAKGAGCKAGFLTNGMNLTNERARTLIDQGLDWIGFSLDGADAETFEAIRAGARFDKVTENIHRMTSMRVGRRPKVMINFVMMKENAHQLSAVIELAKELGVDQVNFKQCDVIRGSNGKGHGLFSGESKQIRQHKSNLEKARKLAKKLGLKTTSFSFEPEEQPVCAQDPRNSIFIRFNGSVAPCINLAMGGPTQFLGREVEMPTVHYGRIPDQNVLELWRSESCFMYRNRFEERSQVFDKAITEVLYATSLPQMEQAENNARAKMPAPPKGCEICHYLFKI